MKFATLFSVFAATAQAQDYFFRYQGGNDITDGQRLRGNISDSTYMLTPGVTLPPHSPDDRKSDALVDTQTQREHDSSWKSTKI